MFSQQFSDLPPWQPQCHTTPLPVIKVCTPTSRTSIPHLPCHWESSSYLTRAIEKAPQLDSLPWLLHSISSKEKKKKDHVTSQVESLHSLRSTHTVKPKLLSITSKVFQTLVPSLTVSCHLPQCSCHPELNVWQIGQVPLTSNSSYKPESFFPPMTLTESQLSFKIQLKCNTSARSSCSWLP